MKFLGVLIVGILSLVGCTAIPLAINQPATNTQAPTVLPTESFRVAFFLADSPEDAGWNAAHVHGIIEAAQALGVVTQQERLALTVQRPDGRILEIRIIEKNGYNDADIERRIRSVIHLWEPDMVFGTWYDSKDAIKRLANEYPDILFEHCSSYPLMSSHDSAYNNLSTYFVRMYEADYVVGFVTGRVYPKLVKRGLVQNSDVGLVATYPIPEPVRGIDAFAQGYQVGLPGDTEGKVHVIWMRSWLDRTAETEAAEAHLNADRQLIRQMADTPTSSQTAEKAGAVAIGYGTDVSKYAPHAIATNEWRWGIYYERRIREAMASLWRPADSWCGIGEGCVRVAGINRDYVDDTLMAEVQSLINDIKSDRIRPLCGPLSLHAAGNDGPLVAEVPAGKCLSDMDLLNLGYFIEGVEGEPPQPGAQGMALGLLDAPGESDHEGHR